jgi:hypothetical protein
VQLSMSEHLLLNQIDCGADPVQHRCVLLLPRSRQHIVLRPKVLMSYTNIFAVDHRSVPLQQQHMHA